MRTVAPSPRGDIVVEEARVDDARELFALLTGRGWYVAPEALLGMKASAIELDAELSGELDALGYGGGEEEAPREP